MIAEENASNTAALENSGAAATQIRAFIASSGRVTALCSYPETTALPPHGTSVLMAIFNACVALNVKITCFFLVCCR